jgi:hypothetical protein
MALLVGCGAEGTVGHDSPTQGGGTQQLTAAQLHGRDVWFNSTFGGEKFFTLILPNAPFNLPIGLDLVLTTPRDVRFDTWGTINDPDCTDGNAETGGLDICADPNASGVVGVRKFPNPTFDPGAPIGPTNEPFLVGVACAGCHAGLDPQNPPADPNHPSWSNIHATVGNQYLDSGKIFGARLSSHDPRKQIFQTWGPGTVDTTLLENDHINNPGIVTQFFNLPNRPFFDLNYFGTPINVHRGGQGGEDDTGCQKAALRVYFNIGMCAAECMVPHLANGPGGTQTEIDIQPGGECEQNCADFVQAEQDVNDMCDFMTTTTPPSLARAPGGFQQIDWSAVLAGNLVFRNNCAGCHSNAPTRRGNVWSDDLLHPMAEIGTNSCRARTTNWQAGHIWGQFSSDEQRARGTGFYRDVPLLGVWATAPFLHNNRVGGFTGDSSVNGRVSAFEDAINQLLTPSASRVPTVLVTDDFVCLNADCTQQLPAGTPVGAFANVNPATGENLCPDFVENEGHDYGTNLSAEDKYRLIEFLKTL